MIITSLRLVVFIVNELCFSQVTYFLSVECGITAVGACSEYDGNMLLAIELFFIGLLALAGLAITWVSGIVVYKLFKGQR